MKTTEIQDRLLEVVKKIDDNNFLLYLYEMLQAKVAESNSKDILDELTKEQYASVFSAIEGVEKGKGIPHHQAIADLRKLLK